MSGLALVKRSSPLLLHRILVDSRNQRLNLRSFSNLSGSSNNLVEHFGEDKNSGFGFFLKSISGIIVGSGLGFWFWSSSPESFSLADWRAEEGQKHSSLPSIEQVKKPRYLFGDAYRRRVFFNYEKRIRLRSPPEKVFEYFASRKNKDGEMFMTAEDLMRAIVPVFPPSESNRVREGYLRGERSPGELQCRPSSFFMLFDTNNDGLISFSEYIFFVTLLSIPESSFSAAFKMFDQDSNGVIERDEFKKVMTLMRSYNRQGAGHRDGLRTGFKSKQSVENGGLVKYFFGVDGKSCLQHETFVKFLRDLQDEIVRLEFSHYDCKSCGTISAKNFALSMVASADMNNINRFLDRVEELNDDPHLRDIRITFEEFKAFADLRKRLQPLALAIFSYGRVNGLLTKKDLQRAASHVCGVLVTDKMLDVIFHVFDTNQDGSLSSDEFLGVLEHRERDIAYPTETGVVGFLSCWLNCSKTCSLGHLIT